jgi:hypothetical protein
MFLTMEAVMEDFVKDIAYVTAKLADEAKAMAKLVYISGPMSGLPEMNYPAFMAAEAKLQAMGYTVVNPARIGADVIAANPNATWDDFMAADLIALRACQAIHFLDGWTNSRGAKIEAKLAMDLRLPKIDI